MFLDILEAGYNAAQDQTYGFTKYHSPSLVSLIKVYPFSISTLKTLTLISDNVSPVFSPAPTISMATKPLTSDVIALTEKKMDMTLDDIIKMSKSSVVKPRKQRVSNKSRRFPNEIQDKSHKIRQYVNSRSTLRQNVLAQRRSSFQGKSFPLATEAAKKASVAPFRSRVNRNRAVNGNNPRRSGPIRQQWSTLNRNNSHKKQHQSYQSGDKMLKQKPNTLDSLFANMKEQRMRTFTFTSSEGAGHRGGERKPVQPWLRGRFGNYRK